MEMINKWVVEFFLYRQQNPKLNANTLFSALEFEDSDDCTNLKIAAVLRDISDSLVHGDVDEKTLDLLETLEKLLLFLQEHSSSSVIVPCSSYLKSAYRWTAVECTAKFMWPENASEGLFSDALKRIWENRIGKLKEKESVFVTKELLKWEIDLIKACDDPEIYQNIRETNVRFFAISHLNHLLKHQWSLLGCCSLESETRKLFLKRKGEETVGNVNAVNANVNVQESDLGDREVAKELKDLLLEIQGQIDTTPPPHRADSGREISRSSSSERVRPRLPTPEPLNVSPLRKVSPRPRGRRRAMKFWTPEEVEALREGVKKYGRSWKWIKEAYPDVLVDRTEVDLKDKWRNFMR